MNEDGIPLRTGQMFGLCIEKLDTCQYGLYLLNDELKKKSKAQIDLSCDEAKRSEKT